MRGPLDFYVQTKLRAVHIEAELVAIEASEATKPAKLTLLARLKTFFAAALFRPVTRRV